MTPPSAPKRLFFRRFFVRGESLVAATGMAFIAILALVAGGVVWVSARTIDESVYSQNEEIIDSTSTFIASQAELRLSNNDLPGLRRLMLDTVASGMVEECEITIPTVGVLASSNPTRSTISEIPATWTSSVDVPKNVVYNSQTHTTTVHEPLTIDGRTGIMLETVVNRSSTAVGSDSIRLSSVGIVSVGLVLMLLVYRRLRNRLGALAAIGEALHAVQNGERRIECLAVGERLGTEAAAWNTLLAERNELEQIDVDREIIEASLGTVEDSIGLPAACNTLTQGVVLVGSDLSVSYANGAGCVFLRTTRENLYNATLDQVPGIEPLIEVVQRVFEQHDSTRHVLEIGDIKDIDSQGAVLRMIVTRVDEGDIPNALIFIEDITQQRLAEDSQSAFIAQATHELRTPLTTIRLYAEEAVEAGSTNEQVRDKALNVINSETRRLERIVGDMLCVSEIEAGSLSIRVDTVRTEQLFRDLEEEYQAQATEKSIELVFDLPPKFPTINADRDRLGQALHNLLGNAIKYTPSGGRVDVKVNIEDTGEIVVEIIDTGIGIDDSQLERIFERFCRADDRRIAQVTGSGIGLSLARQIARLHGGDVTVKSQIDKGSTFTLTIPGTEEKAIAA